MDKSILIEYADMKEEIKDLKRRIEEDKKRLEELNNSIVGDVVTCGRKGKKPLGTAKIEGTPYVRIGTVKGALKKKIRQLEEFEAELLELTNQAEEYIEEMQKSELRTMFRLYFMDDLTYPAVAMQMNSMFPERDIKYTDENVKKRIQRFFCNVPLCPEKV